MTDRKTASTITDTELDALYDQLDDDHKVITHLEEQEKRLLQAEAELKRLHAGEEDGWDPAAYPTPGQWINRFNQATPQERHDAAKWAIENSQRASDCFLSNHEGQIQLNREAWLIVAEVRALEVRLWENADQERRPVSAVCHSIANDLHHALRSKAQTGDESSRTTPDNSATSTNGPIIDRPFRSHRTPKATTPCPACRRADQAGLAPNEQHPHCATTEA